MMCERRDFIIKLGFFDHEFRKTSNFLSEKQINSPPEKNLQYSPRGVAKIEECERHAGREAEKKSSATQQENNSFVFFEHPLDGKVNFVEKSMNIEGGGTERLNLCGEAGGTTETNDRFSGKSWAFSVNNPNMRGKT